MKNLLILYLVCIAACNSPRDHDVKNLQISDNGELQKLTNEDQADRMNTPIDWSIVSNNDKTRKARVLELLDSGLISTAMDYSNAALIFQHGIDTVDSRMAVNMMLKAIELDTTINKWLLAAAIDRDLMRRNQPQVYGTQFIKRSIDQPWKQYEIDTTIVTDAERKEYKVETLAEQRLKLIFMNKKKLSEFLDNGGTIQEIATWSDSALIESHEYNLTENELINLGYALLGEEKLNDAEAIFKLSTVLYPNAYNTFDSYGECLLVMDKKEEGIAAYKKSLELNPENEHATNVLKKLM